MLSDGGFTFWSGWLGHVPGEMPSWLSDGRTGVQEDRQLPSEVLRSSQADRTPAFLPPSPRHASLRVITCAAPKSILYERATCS